MIFVSFIGVNLWFYFVPHRFARIGYQRTKNNNNNINGDWLHGLIRNARLMRGVFTATFVLYILALGTAHVKFCIFFISFAILKIRNNPRVRTEKRIINKMHVYWLNLIHLEWNRYWNITLFLLWSEWFPSILLNILRKEMFYLLF